jgi:hypothetical protein
MRCKTREAKPSVQRPRVSAMIPSPILQASCNQSGAPKGGDSGGFLEVMGDPYEWKSAVRLALALFVASLALAPALAPDQQKLAAAINHQTLGLAAALKSSTR